MEPKNNKAMEKQWLDGLVQQTETHTEAPPEEWWDDIERQIDGATPGAAAKKSRTRRRAVFGWIGSGIAAAVIAALVFLNIPGGVVDEPVGTQSPTTAQESREPEPKVNVTTEPEPVTTTPPKTSTESIYAAVEPTVKDGLSSETGVPEETVPALEETTTAPETEIMQTDCGDARPEGTPEKRPAETSPATTGTMGAGAYFPQIPTARPRGKRWQAGLFASNISSASANNGGDATMIPSGPMAEPEFTDIQHRLPLTVGITVSRALGGRWSLTSGVNYTMLSSQFRTEDKTVYQTRRQTLHNIGIPLNINYTVWQGTNLSFYLSAGGQVEKSVSGNAADKYIEYGTVVSEWSKSVSDRLQWSVGGALGLQYDLSNTAGLYFEPGVNYYFDNGSPIKTVYKTKPLNFGFRAGVRFSW